MGHKNVTNRNRTTRIIHDTRADEKILRKAISSKLFLGLFCKCNDFNKAINNTRADTKNPAREIVKRKAPWQ